MGPPSKINKSNSFEVIESNKFLTNKIVIKYLFKRACPMFINIDKHSSKLKQPLTIWYGSLMV